MKKNIAGFTVVEILIVLAIIAILGAMVVPSYFKMRKNARASICTNNLRLITQAVAQYQIDNGIPDGVEIDLYENGIMSTTNPSAYIQRDLTCPETNIKYPNVKTGQVAVCQSADKFPDHVFKKTAK